MNVLTRLLQPRSEAAYTFLRIVAGLMFAFHGLEHVFGIFSTPRPPVGSQAWVGGLIELVGGFAIASGLFTTLAAFLASGTMAVAYVQFHWKLALGSAFFPIVNKGELALLYSVLFLFVACRGSGAYGLDALLRRPTADPTGRGERDREGLPA